MSVFNKQMNAALAKRAAATGALKAAFSDAGTCVKEQTRRLTDAKPITGLIEKYPFAVAGLAAGAGLFGALAIKRVLKSCTATTPGSLASVSEPQRVIIEVQHGASATVRTPKPHSFVDLIKQAVAGYQTVQNVLKPLLAKWLPSRRTPSDDACEDGACDDDAAPSPGAPLEAIVPPPGAEAAAYLKIE